MKQILINRGELETRVAVVESGKIDDFSIERYEDDHLAGSIFKGRIKNLEPSLQAAFVDIGAEKNAFLHYWDMLPATKEMLEGGGSRQPREMLEPEDEDGGEDEATAENNGGDKGGVLGIFKKIFHRKATPAAPEAAESESTQRPRRRRRGRGRNQQQKQNSAPQEPFAMEDIPNLFKVNSEVLVQVTKGPIGTKGARVTTNLSIPGRYLVLLPNATHIGVSRRIEDRRERQRLKQILNRLKLPQGMGLICRTAGAERDESSFQIDLAILLRSWVGAEDKIKNERAPCCIYREPDLAERFIRDCLSEDVDEIITDSQKVFDLADEIQRTIIRKQRLRIRLHSGSEPLFARYRIKEQVENIFRPRVPLPGGGYLCIDETEALIAIDVNSGKNRAGKDHPETILNTNLEAVEEVARQVRLRNIGGLIVIDLIDMRSKKDQQTVYRALRDAMVRDRARTKILPISPLGLVEMTRQREQESVQDTMFSNCPYCSGKGMIKSATSISIEIQRRLQEILRKNRGRKPPQLRVNIHPAVLERLKNTDADLIKQMEGTLGGQLSFRADPGIHMEEFQIVNQETGNNF